MIISREADEKPILFLDIDGTLGPEDQFVEMKYFQPWPKACAAIGRLVRLCDARIVISSARLGDERLSDHVGALVVPDEPWRIVGECDPKRASEKRERRAGRVGLTSKEAMVVQWLEAAEANSALIIRPERWAVLDDKMGDGPPWQLAGRIVKVDGPITDEQWWALWALLASRSLWATQLASWGIEPTARSSGLDQPVRTPRLGSLAHGGRASL